MIKRILTGALCCLLAAMLPLCALAKSPAHTLLEEGFQSGKAVEATLSIEPGAALGEQPMVRDLLNALVLRFAARNDGVGALTLALNELDENGALTGTCNDVLAATVRAGADGLYLSTAALGEQPVYVSTEDATAFLTQSVQQMPTTGTLPISTIVNIAGSKAMALDPNVSDEELRAALVQSFGDEALADIALDIKSRMVTTEGDFTAAEHDAAVRKYEITLTQADFKAIVNTNYARKQLEKSAATIKNNEMTVDEMIAKANDMLDRSEISVPLVMLLNAENKLVSLTCDVTAHVPENDADATEYDDISVPVRYTRKTSDEGVSYVANLDAYELGDSAQALQEPQGRMTAVAFHGADGSLSAMLDVSEYDDGDYESEFAAELEYGWTGNQATGTLLVKSEGKDAARLVLTQDVAEAAMTNALAVYMGANTDPLLTLHFDIALTDGTAAMDSLLAATPADCAQIAQMSSEEMQAYLLSVQSSAMNVLLDLFSKLPQSLGAGLTQLMSMGQ